MSKKLCGVYRINSPSGRFYVGSSFDIYNRWHCHKRDLRRGHHHSKALQRACDKYGLDALEFELLLVCAEEHARFYEQRAIDILRPAYNATSVASNSFKDFWTDPSWRKRNSERRAQMNRDWFADPANKAAAASRAATHLSSPQAKRKSVESRNRHFREQTDIGIKLRRQSSERMKALMADPNFKASHAERKRMEMIKRCSDDPEFCRRRDAAAAEANRKPIRLVNTGEVFASKEWAAMAKGISVSLITKQLSGKPTRTGYVWEFLPKDTQ